MITQWHLEPLKDPKFIRPALMRYCQDGVMKSWEVIQAHDSVAILLYHLEKEAFVLVKQFRPALYLQHKKPFSIELCAGIVDKALPLVQIAKEEICEETGYDVPLEAIERVSAFYTSVGFAGTKQTLYYAKVDEAMRLHEGGGIDEEAIEVVELPLKEAKTFLYDESIPKTPGLMLALMWFFEHLAKEKR